MPRTKTTKTDTPKKAGKVSKSASLANLKPRITPSYTSLLYGVVTVLVLFALIFAGLRNFTHKAPNPDIKDGIQTVNQQPTQKTYTVQEGDSLWTIAEQEYNDGFQWKKIADANKLTNPSAIDKGMKLVIPEAPKVIAQAEPSETPAAAESTIAPNKTESQVMVAQTTKGGLPVNNATPTAMDNQPSGSITGNSYTVQHGDNLWEIAVRAYGDGYRWVEIAKANNLANPGIIHSGNVFVIPR